MKLGKHSSYFSKYLLKSVISSNTDSFSIIELVHNSKDISFNKKQKKLMTIMLLVLWEVVFQLIIED